MEGQLSASAIFIHSAVDDAGLTAAEFRVLAHISRRAGNGECNAAVPSIATHCGLHPDTVRASIKTLAERVIIRRQERQGATALLTVNHATESWKPAPLRNEGTTRKRREGSTPKQREWTPPKRMETKVIPLKVIPSKDSPAAAGDDSKSPFRLFTDGWMERHQKHFGEPYLFTKAKDGSAVARLIKSGTAPEELLAIAEKAWQRPDGFNCKAAASIAGFASRFNEIRAELRGPARKTPTLITPDFSKGF